MAGWPIYSINSLIKMFTLTVLVVFLKLMGLGRTGLHGMRVRLRVETALSFEIDHVIILHHNITALIVLAFQLETTPAIMAIVQVNFPFKIRNY